METQILLVEGQRSRALSCALWLEKKGYQVTCVHTRRKANALLEKEMPDLLIVDARFLRFNPYRFCQALRRNGNSVPLLLILPEEQDTSGCGATAVLQGQPTPRRLLHRVKRLLPGSGGEVLRAGDLALDLKRRTVTRGLRTHRLTPKQTHLLEVFIRNQGRVLTRAFLMREVWSTDYVDDTRTLEVHVHWLRQAIEEDPSQPFYLTTVRGVGYRFDVPRVDPSEP